MTTRPGIDPFNDDADQYFERYLKADPAKVHADLVPHLPKRPALVLDVGAGMLRDAAWLADMGHTVVAVEPAENLLQLGAQHFKDKKIHAAVDSLPDLKSVKSLGRKFDLIMVGAVWMFIPPEQREASMKTLKGLIAPGGRLYMNWREADPVRGMHAVAPTEITDLAGDDMLCIAEGAAADELKRADVAWKSVVLSDKRMPAGPDVYAPPLWSEKQGARHGKSPKAPSP